MVAASPKTYSPEDLLTMSEGDNYDLVNGQLVERPVSALSSYVANRIATALTIVNDKATLGWVYPDNTSFQCFRDDPRRVRKVDTAFIQASRMTVEQVRTQGHIAIVPDLVVEIVSPNDLAYDVNHKIEEWLSAGVKIVWVIDPESKVVYSHGLDNSLIKFRTTDDLIAEELLPGFRCSVAGLFP